MARFTIQYHLAHSDFVPQEAIDAETLVEAANMAGLRISRGEGEGDVIIVPSGDDLITIPRPSVVYCHVRAVLDRRRAAPVVYEGPANEETSS